MPDPASAEHTPAVVDVAMPLIEASAGGCFVLFTSHRALQRAAGLLQVALGADGSAAAGAG